MLLNHSNTCFGHASDLEPGDWYIRTTDAALQRDGVAHGYRVDDVTKHRDPAKVMLKDSGANSRPMAKDAPVRIWVRGKSML